MLKMLKIPFKSYVDPDEQREANRQLPKLMFEGLLLGGTGLGVLALIFEIAADAFSVAAYQTLLAIHGAGGRHDIAILAFIALSIMLFFGVVPAYKAAAYLRPNAGGSGPLVEAIGPPRLRWASWAGTSLFFIDAVLTIIISSLSAADVTMLFLPQLVDVRIFVAQFYAFFIMAVLVALGPKRAVPLFLLGGGAFTIFTLFGLGYIGITALSHPDFAARTPGIVAGLEESGVITHIVGDLGAITQVVFFQALLRSMSSAMLGFSGYEVIPASGKHAARPKWKVINTALTLAALFLIGTGIVQLFAAQQWNIPATEGYSTLLIQYEIVFGQSSILVLAGVLLAIILLLAQGGGYVGGAAVAANAARLGRMPRAFLDDRIGIAVIWGVSAILIPIIREVVVVESFYAFGFVSAFIITSTTVFFVRDDVLRDRNLIPGSIEVKSLKFAGLRGMVASYIMGIILITQKSDALVPIILFGALLTAFQIVVSRGGVKREAVKPEIDFGPCPGHSTRDLHGLERAYDQARQRGVAHAVSDLLESGAMAKFNVEPHRIRRLVNYVYGVEPEVWDEIEKEHEPTPEPSAELDAIYDRAYAQKEAILHTIESYSHYGIFTFIEKYAHNWVSEYRDDEVVQRAMLEILFPLTALEDMWNEYRQFKWEPQHEEIWQFARQRYQWAKDQWPNLSDRITTIWTLQDVGLLKPKDEKKVQQALVLLNKRIRQYEIESSHYEDDLRSASITD
ncbi:MAG: APC family permease [Chloroflexi bacterium]|nr:MAG: hypothetical protein CUN54_06180 [Phototrophicales bacterium]RMF79133.1 MAG: APC family permease [Chloroflexota bacterium]